MSLENLLNHTCDVYHARERNASPGYGLPGEPRIKYPDKPDITGLPCHFAVKGASISVSQGAPINVEDAKVKLTFPAGADVRLNDIIVRLETGERYTAERPVDVRGHHRFVYVKKIDGQGYL